MKLSKPSHFETPHLIYDPVEKGALIINYDHLIKLPGPFEDYAQANAAMRKALEMPQPKLLR